MAQVVGTPLTDIKGSTAHHHQQSYSPEDDAHGSQHVIFCGGALCECAAEHIEGAGADVPKDDAAGCPAKHQCAPPGVLLQ